MGGEMVVTTSKKHPTRNEAVCAGGKVMGKTFSFRSYHFARPVQGRQYSLDFLLRFVSRQNEDALRQREMNECDDELISE